jgi:hypothetical protein
MAVEWNALGLMLMASAELPYFTNDWTLLESDNINTVFIDDTTHVYGTDRGAALHSSECTKWDWLVYTTSEGLI